MRRAVLGGQIVQTAVREGRPFCISPLRLHLLSAFAWGIGGMGMGHVNSQQPLSCSATRERVEVGNHHGFADMSNSRPALPGTVERLSFETRLRRYARMINHGDLVCRDGVSG